MNSKESSSARYVRYIQRELKKMENQEELMSMAQEEIDALKLKIYSLQQTNLKLQEDLSRKEGPEPFDQKEDGPPPKEESGIPVEERPADDTGSPVEETPGEEHKPINSFSVEEIVRIVVMAQRQLNGSDGNCVAVQKSTPLLLGKIPYFNGTEIEGERQSDLAPSIFLRYVEDATQGDEWTDKLRIATARVNLKGVAAEAVNTEEWTLIKEWKDFKTKFIEKFQTRKLGYRSYQELLTLKRMRGETVRQFTMRLQSRADSVARSVAGVGSVMCDAAVKIALQNSLPLKCHFFFQDGKKLSVLIDEIERYLECNPELGLTSDSIVEEKKFGKEESVACSVAAVKQISKKEVNNRRYCQVCSSKDHWTIHCPDITTAYGQISLKNIKEKSRSASSGGGGAQFDGYCFACGAYGHRAASCYASWKASSYVVCYRCGQQGHTSKYCQSSKNLQGWGAQYQHPTTPNTLNAGAPAFHPENPSQ